MKGIWGALLSACALVFSGAASAQDRDSSTAVEWSLEEVKEIVNEVRAGRDLTPKSWPGGARIAVLLSFDVDNETVYLRFGAPTVGKLSQGQFGARVGLGRVVDILDKHEVPASFYIPGVSLELAPEQAELMTRSGRHEIGVHGWIHELPSSIEPEQEREMYTRAIKSLTEKTGYAPVGFRSPSWDFSRDTLNIIRGLGFYYDSSLMADDRPYELVANGKPTGMVELPVSWIMDDAVYLSTGAHSSLSPRDFYTMLKDDFDRAYEEKTMFLLTMHPPIIGQRSSIWILEELIEYIKTKPDVWFATHRSAAEYVAQEAGLPSPAQ